MSSNEHVPNVIQNLIQNQINESSSDFIINLMDKLTSFLIKKSRVIRDCPKGKGLRIVRGFLQVVFSSASEKLKERVQQCYKVCVETEGYRDDAAKKINFWSFSPSFG